MKLPLHLFDLTEDQMRRLLHMTGSDYPDHNNKGPNWRNHANLDINDKIMLELKDKKLVKAQNVEGYSASAMWYATQKGIELSEAIYYIMAGKKQIKNLRAKLEKANVLLNDNGLKYFQEFED